MADLKISQLGSIVTVVPATDVLPVVQGATTYKMTPNQILGSGGVATLASATITGAATVGTTLGVTGVSTLASVGVTGAATVGTTLGVTGVSSFAAGTALLPSITRTGDTNTGAYFPAADTFAVTTGGTEAYRADSLGNFLVGTSTSPTGTKVGAIAKLSTVSIEGTASIAVSTTAVTLSRVSGLGGLFFVQGYADGSGVQAWWLVGANNTTTAVIASGNTTGLVPTFTIVAGQLKMVLASGTFYATSFNITT